MINNRRVVNLLSHSNPNLRDNIAQLHFNKTVELSSVSFGGVSYKNKKVDSINLNFVKTMKFALKK